jgi:hypothetical protein
MSFGGKIDQLHAGRIYGKMLRCHADRKADYIPPIYKHQSTEAVFCLNGIPKEIFVVTISSRIQQLPS